MSGVFGGGGVCECDELVMWQLVMAAVVKGQKWEEATLGAERNGLGGVIFAADSLSWTLASGE